MGTKEEKMAQAEQWYEALLITKDEVLEAQITLIQNSSSTSLHTALKMPLAMR